MYFNLPLACSSKEYRLIQLENGIPVLLISNPQSEDAACCVCVATGSHNDPADIPGLAHLCEHMVFMGTKRFPGPNEFLEKLEVHQGSSNAFTTGEQTCVYFETPVDSAFDDIFNNFVDMFHKPLFRKALIRWEIYAVNSEHEGNKTNADKVLYHALRILSSPKHPFHRFGTGSKETLSTSVQKALRAYFSKYFVSERMSIVLRGPQSLDDLQKLAEKFKGGKTNSVSGEFSILQSAFPATPVFEGPNMGKIISIPWKSPMVRVFFPFCTLPRDIAFYSAVWCELIGDESSGSLCDILTQRGHILNLYCFTQRLAVGTSALIIDMELTRMGCKAVNNVILTVLHYITGIGDMAAKDVAQILQQKHTERELKYQYSEASTSEVCDLAQTLQENMAVLKPHNIVRSYPDFNYDSAKVHDFIGISKGSLSIKNFSVVVMGVDKASLGTFQSRGTDPHYGFEYEISQVDKNSILADLQSITHEWFVPSAAHFDTVKKALEETSSVFSRTNSKYSSMSSSPPPMASAGPSLLEYRNGYELWHRQEMGIEHYNKVTASIQMHGDLSINVHTMVCIDILCALWGSHLKQKMYSSEQANFSWGLFPSPLSTPAISLDIRGLKQGIAGFVGEILGSFEEFCSHVKTLEYAAFKKERVRMRSELTELDKSDGMKQVLAGSILLLEENVFGLEERIGALEEIALEDVAKIAAKFKASSYIELFISGDCSREDAREIAKMIKLPVAPSPPQISSSYFLRPGTRYRYETASRNKSEEFETVYQYFQVGTREDPTAVMVAKVLAHFLSISCEHELRTKRRLGYCVLSGFRLLRDTVGVYICVISGSHQAKTIAQEIDQYLEGEKKRLGNMSQDDFTDFLQPFIKTLGERSKNVLQPNLAFGQQPCAASTNFDVGSKSYLAHKNYWDKIITKSYRFKGLHGDEYVDPSTVQALSKEALMQHFSRYLGGGRTSLTICVHKPGIRGSIKHLSLGMDASRVRGDCMVVRSTASDLDEFVEDDYLDELIGAYDKEEG